MFVCHVLSLLANVAVVCVWGDPHNYSSLHSKVGCNCAKFNMEALGHSQIDLDVNKDDTTHQTSKEALLQYHNTIKPESNPMRTVKT